MSFMIADILGNTTKRRTEVKHMTDVESKVSVAGAYQHGEEFKENIPAPESSILPQKHPQSDLKSTSPVQQVVKRPRSLSPTPSYSSERSASPTDSESEPRRKKLRTSFTNDQIQYLERVYVSQRYLASNNRTELAKMLQLSETQIKTWFQNRRMKEKRQIKGVEDRLGGTVPGPSVSPHPGLGRFPAAGLGGTMPGPSVSPHPALGGFPAAGPEFPGYSPASSPALSPGLPAHIPTSAAAQVFGGLPLEALGFYGQLPPVLGGLSPVTSPAGGLPFPGHYPASYPGLPGVSPAGYHPINPAALGMVPSAHFGHSLMGPAIL